MFASVESALLDVVVKINTYLSNYILVFLLVAVGLWYSIKTHFVQVRCFGEGMKKVFGNLSGRTGRGDTTFAGYITERQRSGIAEALQYCTALVSLKMETPGPFQGTRQDVLDYIHTFY